MMNSVMSQGLNGMQQSQARMLQSAHQISRTGQPAADGQRLTEESGAVLSGETTSVNDLASNSVELKKQEHIFTASAKVVSVADKSLGTLLDIKA